MKKRQREVRLIRAGIQLAFFIAAPSLFSTAFAGIKSIFLAIAGGQPVEWNSFLTVTAVLLVITCFFGRHFCGYACAFGSLGDAVRSLYVFLCKKCKKKPITWKPKKLPLHFLKYGILLVVGCLCFTGVYSDLKGWNPWDVFSMLRAGNVHLGGYWLGILLLAGILVGMALCDRFFCRFLLVLSVGKTSNIPRCLQDNWQRFLLQRQKDLKNRLCRSNSKKTQRQKPP